jgi:mercuric ion transport protein
METSLATLAVCKPKAVNLGHTWFHDTRVPSRRQFASLGRRRGANDVCFVQAVQMKGWLFPLSLGGAGLAAVCCLTPFLPWLFSLLGISGVLGYVYRDDVLLPILAVFLILTGYALWQRRQAK